MNTIKDALERIQGSIINGYVIYYDDAMDRYYIGPAEDLADLAKLMNSDDEDIARDAYSHWCRVNYHGEGYRTEAEAVNAAKAQD